MNRFLPSLTIRLTAGLVAGLAGGLLFSLTVGTIIGFLPHLIISGVLGILFALFIGRRLKTAGGGMIWGEAYGILWWLVGYLTLIPLALGDGVYWQPEEIRALFPLLLGQTIAYGAVLGLVYYCIIRFFTGPASADDHSHDHAEPAKPRGQEILPPRLLSIIIGGLGGLFGSWVFLIGIQVSVFFPLVAGLIGSESSTVGQLLHYLIGMTIGAGFGLLFYRDIHGTGSAIIWGMAYGITWWILGPLTLGFLLGGVLPSWSLAAAQESFEPLTAHILYGALVGLFYTLAKKLWNALFVDSDPLNRTRESAGARGLRGLLMGQAAGVVGGLLFTIVMVSTNSLPRVASLVGGSSPFVGFVVHFVIAILIGSTFGVFFHNEAYSYGSGMGWGLSYGFLWWLLGPGTLFFLLLRQPVDWSLAATVARFPALVGHLLYGMGLGLFFQYLIRRYDTHQHHEDGTPHVHQTSGSPAAALWAVTLLIGILMPLLLG